ncbi:MAG: hypothetical protein HY308_07160 [Gammaproteobacteria bacterium]|nr:hypothetical protein [Gammaproteobacteria bacterium]
MTVYQLSTTTNDKKLGALVFAHENAPGEEAHVATGHMKENWKPMQFQWFLNKNQKRKNLVVNDFVLVFGTFVNIALNEKARKVLEPALGSDAEFLPIKLVGEESEAWYLLNVVHRIDNAVSAEKSHYTELSTGKRVLTRPVFVENNIPNDRIFVYPYAYHRAVIKGESLKSLVATHKLTGLLFHVAETVEGGTLPKSAAG